MKTPLEIELKYAVSDPSVFAALLELRALGTYTLRPDGEQYLIDHYLDTPNRDLLRGGYVCRVREGETAGRWLLTVKRLGEADGTVLRREQYEREIAPYETPADWPESSAREIVTRLAKGEALAELFTLRQRRARRVVEHHGRPVGVLSLDMVDADVGGHPMVFRELEIELQPAGTVDDLHALEAELRQYKLSAQSNSKFERALALLDEAPAGSAPGKKRVPGVRADEPLAEAGRKILRFHFLRMVANEDGTRKGTDPDALHDMRVATRRQRAVFRIIAPYFRRKVVAPFRDELRTLAGRLGAVRDLDVLIGAADDYRSSLGIEPREALGPLLDEWRKQRDAARDELLTHLNGGDYQAFIQRYRVFLASPGEGVKDGAPGEALRPHLVRHILPAQIWDQYGRVRAYETVLGVAPIETIHALRIDGKRLRYLLEFFSEVLGSGLPEAVEKMVALQDHLGELHDTYVTIGLLRDFLMRTTQRPLAPVVADSVGGYLRVKQARLRTLQRTLQRPWRRVTSRRFRKILARAVAEL